MGARCNVCGQSVMAYRRYAAHSRATATCDACGSEVRLRGFYWIVGAGALLVAGLFAVAVAVDSKSAMLQATVVLVFLGVAVDYVGYRTLGWDPVDEASD